MTARIIEDLTSLSLECKRVLPAVREVSERTLVALKSSPTSTPIAGLAPFIIACNHTDAPKKVLSLSLGALQRLVVLDIVPLTDMASIVHVLEIQVCAIPINVVTRLHPLLGLHTLFFTPTPRADCWRTFLIDYFSPLQHAHTPLSPFFLPTPPSRLSLSMRRRRYG